MLNTTIAHYKVTAKLGQGGMGEVYRATDTKLDREVAIKVLPESFAQDKERLARFEREAKVLASLNHPNIAGIYGLEQTGNSHALVLELRGSWTAGLEYACRSIINPGRRRRQHYWVPSGARPRSVNCRTVSEAARRHRFATQQYTLQCSIIYFNLYVSKRDASVNMRNTVFGSR